MSSAAVVSAHRDAARLQAVASRRATAMWRGLVAETDARQSTMTTTLQSVAREGVEEALCRASSVAATRVGHTMKSLAATRPSAELRAGTRGARGGGGASLVHVALVHELFGAAAT